MNPSSLDFFEFLTSVCSSNFVSSAVFHDLANKYTSSLIVTGCNVTSSIVDYIPGPLFIQEPPILVNWYDYYSEPSINIKDRRMIAGPIISDVIYLPITWRDRWYGRAWYWIKKNIFRIREKTFDDITDASRYNLK